MLYFPAYVFSSSVLNNSVFAVENFHSEDFPSFENFHTVFFSTHIMYGLVEKNKLYFRSLNRAKFNLEVSRNTVLDDTKWMEKKWVGKRVKGVQTSVKNTHGADLSWKYR